VIDSAQSKTVPMKNAVTIAVIAALLSIAYYFAIALPHQDAAKLQLERDKFEQEEKLRQATEEANSARQQEIEKAKDQAETKLLVCEASAESKYNRGLELNGTPVPGKKGVYNGSRALFDGLKKEQREENAACQRQYELDLKAAEQR
jgi:hypothetical protein